MVDLATLYQVTNKKTRSISAENFHGEPGKGGMCPVEEGVAQWAASDLGMGWKVNPYVRIAPGMTFELANIKESGTINHIWIVPDKSWRDMILRIYWDGQEQPSVECPVGDFFCMGWDEYSQINSLAVCVNSGGALNCYWQMPFKSNCRMTLENTTRAEKVVYYQIDYTLEEHPEEIAYFHAQFRRVNPLPYKDVYTIVDGIEGKGQYVGTYMAWGSNNNGWWGEGEIKFYMDDDEQFPTICGTGTEDYFCGAYSFENPVTHDHYLSYSGPYAGFHEISRDRLNRSQMRFGMYRWHIVDPIRFEKKLKVTIQALGWRKDRRYLPLQEDLASVAFWYQTLPTAAFPELPDKDYLEVI